MKSPLVKRILAVAMTLACMIGVTILTAKFEDPNGNPVLHIGPFREKPVVHDLGPVPAFTVEGLKDADLKGKPRLVVMFASWCGPCRIEEPVLIKLSKSIPIYGVAVTDEEKSLERYLKRENPYSKVGFDGDGAVGIAFGVEGLPTSFIVNADGHIVWRHDGPLSPDDATDAILPLMDELNGS
ncbi:MAG TPA: redoxin family protein [Patescibacteria group bacterium]|nr:redoxin family protein [Patescibacteria group bacterium]